MSIIRLGSIVRQLFRGVSHVRHYVVGPPVEFGGEAPRYINMPEFAREPLEPQKTYAEIKAGTVDRNKGCFVRYVLQDRSSLLVCLVAKPASQDRKARRNAPVWTPQTHMFGLWTPQTPILLTYIHTVYLYSAG